MVDEAPDFVAGETGGGGGSEGVGEEIPAGGASRCGHVGGGGGGAPSGAGVGVGVGGASGVGEGVGVGAGSGVGVGCSCCSGGRLPSGVLL